MVSELNELRSKLELSFRFVDAVYLFRNEQVNDSAKRAVSRFLMMQIDNLLVIAPRLKNLIFRHRSSSERARLEEAITTLRKSYDKSYDLIRDKIGAHGQPLDEMSCFRAWGGLDYSTTEVLYSDIKQLQSVFEVELDCRFPTIPDYEPLNIAGNKWLVEAAGSHLRFDRFAAIQPSTGYMISLHPCQDKVQLILSVLEFLNVDFAITRIVDDPKSIYQQLVFDVGWLMALTDLCSLIDNLFVDTEHDKSLLTMWDEAGVGGHDDLIRLRGARNLSTEEEVRSIRNKLAAHIDRDEEIQAVLNRYLSLNLGTIYDYFVALADGFFEACSKDFRTRIFVYHDTPMNRLEKISGEGMPFDDSGQ